MKLITKHYGTHLKALTLYSSLCNSFRFQYQTVRARMYLIPGYHVTDSQLPVRSMLPRSEKSVQKRWR